ncbi:hypothetical protein R3P38DRAFT_3324968 [Favolaschia claudopus]|uniref:Uncharacterized protein n=1 Tax=Favolaschia claudopus TaxID=2862362 RepID=A0AAW0AEX3_9AGAR
MSAESTNEKAHPWYAQFTGVNVQNTERRGIGDAIFQAFLRFVAPTTSRAYISKDAYFRTTFSSQVTNYNEHRKRIKQLYLVSRLRRLSQLNQLVDRLNLSDPPEQWDDEIEHIDGIIDKSLKTRKMGIRPSMVNSTRTYEVLDIVPSIGGLGKAEDHLRPEDMQLMNDYCESIKQTKALRSHLQDVDEDLANFAHLVATQATAEFTCFRGLRDCGLTDDLATALVAISTLGAGLVYSTVFGATRGDVGLMCHSFPFFSIGFLLPVTVQTLLRWGANLKNEVKFASQPFWTIVIGLVMSLSFLSVGASLTILNLTIFFLRNDSDMSLPDPPRSSAPGIIAFGITGSIFLLMLTAVILSAIAAKVLNTLKGMRAVLSAMYGTNGNQQDALKLYLPV